MACLPGAGAGDQAALRIAPEVASGIEPHSSHSLLAETTPQQGRPSSRSPGTRSVAASLTLMISLVLQLLCPLLTRISVLDCLVQDDS